MHWIDCSGYTVLIEKASTLEADSIGCGTPTDPDQPIHSSFILVPAQLSHPLFQLAQSFIIYIVLRRDLLHGDQPSTPSSKVLQGVVDHAHASLACFASVLWQIDADDRSIAADDLV